MKPIYYIGIMSGTSLDGVDAVLVDFSNSTPVLVQTFFCVYCEKLRMQLLSLHRSDYDELHRAAMLSNELSILYAEAATGLLKNSRVESQDVIAIGCHGQTVRHCPEAEKKYTIQLVNAALLAELTQITVVADFRSRDIAAGGQGAPLVPAFHHDFFRDSLHHRVIVNIGGIANITRLDPHNETIGFDCGPGNILLDAWCLRHTGRAYDKDGQWAMTGKVIPALLGELLEDYYFLCKPPKSSGRELFNVEWLGEKLVGNELPEDVQATLLQLTALIIARAIQDYCPTATEVYVCGGGAHNTLLMSRLIGFMPYRKIALTDQLGIAADWVEAFAFAWLAKQAILRKPSNMVTVTGARGNRILGAIHPA